MRDTVRQAAGRLAAVVREMHEAQQRWLVAGGKAGFIFGPGVVEYDPLVAKEIAQLAGCSECQDETARLTRELAEARVDTVLLDALQALVLNGADVCADTELWTPPRIFIQKEGCGGPDYVYHGDGDLRAAIRAAGKGETG